MFSLQFAPDLVIVAAGFDAEKTDSLVSCPVYFAEIFWVQNSKLYRIYMHIDNTYSNIVIIIMLLI